MPNVLLLKEEIKKIQNTENSQKDHEFYNPFFRSCWSLYLIPHFPDLKHKKEYLQLHNIRFH